MVHKVSLFCWEAGDAIECTLAYPLLRHDVFKLPVSLCKRIQSVVIRFWWDNNENTRKMAWVSWDSIAKPKSIGGLGLRDFLKFNDALLAKIGWRLLQNPTCLLAKVLKGKYYKDCDFLQASEPSVLSHGWRSVLAGRDLLLKNIGWAVGDGLSINIWRDPWMSLVSQERPMGPPTESTTELRVADLLMEGEMQWDRRKIQLLIPDYETAVLCIKPSISRTPDRLIWLGSKSG